jgi:DNA-directed RNA polymerase specialized sigma54-like protein
LAVLLHRLPPEKLEEYTTYPLMAQLGFIHAIPEEEFDISTATITDISFIGLFPKMVFQAMKHYERECPNRNFNSGECYSLMDAFVKDFVHRTITIQKVVHILVSHQKAKLALLVSP